MVVFRNDTLSSLATTHCLLCKTHIGPRPPPGNDTLSSLESAHRPLWKRWNVQIIFLIALITELYSGSQMNLILAPNLEFDPDLGLMATSSTPLRFFFELSFALSQTALAASQTPFAASQTAPRRLGRRKGRLRRRKRCLQRQKSCLRRRKRRFFAACDVANAVWSGVLMATGTRCRHYSVL